MNANGATPESQPESRASDGVEWSRPQPPVPPAQPAEPAMPANGPRPVGKRLSEVKVFVPQPPNRPTAAPRPPLPPVRPIASGLGAVPSRHQPPPAVNPPQPAGESITGSPQLAAASLSAKLSDSLPDSLTDKGLAQRLRLRLPRSWQFWAVIGVMLSSGVGALAIALMLKLPSLPNCPAIFWPTASASLRLYCADIAANKETPDDLLEAIALVDSLPANHPMRPEINRRIEEWSVRVLDLANDLFNAGKLDEAVATVKKLPPSILSAANVGDRVKQWETTWAEAEEIYQTVQAAIKREDYRTAFDTAIRLLTIGNRYWETTQYEALNRQITAARNDSSKITQAQRLVRRGGLDNLLAAVKLIETIQPNSPVYPSAQRAMHGVGQAMLSLAEANLEDGNSDQAIEIARQIPAGAGLEGESQDFINVAMAHAQSRGGTIADIEAAILQAQRIGPERPYYSRVQDWIRRWELEIEGVRHIDLARQLAAPGQTGDWQAAIAEAELVERGNPRYREAQALISDWTARVQRAEDGPILERARQLATIGDTVALQAAIDQVSQIPEGHVLYPEVRSLTREWRTRIQTIQDQPYLTQARQLANAGRLSDAIAVAGQIRSGRSLYDEAQQEIKTWQNQIDGQALLQQAYETANAGTTDMLVSAIRLAQQVPDQSATRDEADRMANTWSQAILRQAETRAQSDLTTAIAIAQTIPPRTDAYAEAQLRIQIWQQRSSQELDSSENLLPQ